MPKLHYPAIPTSLQVVARLHGLRHTIVPGTMAIRSQNPGAYREFAAFYVSVRWKMYTTTEKVRTRAASVVKY